MIRMEEKITPPLEGAWAYYIEDLSSGEVYAEQEYRPFYAASIIKMLILYEALLRIDAGRQDPHEILESSIYRYAGGSGIISLLKPLRLTFLELIKLMIAVSDNSASNTLIHLLGKDRINITASMLGLAGTRLNRDFMDISGPPNTAAPADMAVLFRGLLEADSKVPLNKTARELGLSICMEQQVNDGLTANLVLCGSCGTLLSALNQCPSCGTHAWDILSKPVPCAHKTGEVPGVFHDGGIIFCGKKACIAVGMTEGLKDNRDGRRFLQELGRSAYLGMLK